jgi:hypothetical protein
MNFKDILNENLENMMNDLKGMKDPNSNVSNVESPQVEIKNQTNSSNVKIIFDKNKNEYQIIDMDGVVYATIKDKNKIPLVLDTLKSYAH